MPWTTEMLFRHFNVACKVSGLKNDDIDLKMDE